ncbi:WLM domain-containing protein [Mycena haematopus]|nr:WLM domain-containing protein [Mycena haematopus]
MVHVRLNERETNPNPYVNFISALDTGDPESQEDARQLLRALAAQVKPVMKAYGLVVNSLEEYEFNRVFAGRNWNNGETVGKFEDTIRPPVHSKRGTSELVLRGPDGLYQPTYYIMSTLCHELAHIKHMNHGPAFQALWKRFRAEVRALQDKGYYGDGMWSSGHRLMDSAEVSGDGITEAGEFPEFLCGGAQKQSRSSALGRKRRVRQPRRETVASNKTGRQTAKRRKAGGRVKSQSAFSGEGALLTEGALDPKGKGVGFRKQAGSKRAREERALAAEQRLKVLQAAERRTKALQAESPKASTSNSNELESAEEDKRTDAFRRASTSKASSQPESDEIDEEIDDPDEDDFGDEPVGETDAERRQALLRSGNSEDLVTLNDIDWKDFQKDFNFTRHNTKDAPEPIEISSEDDIPIASGSTFVMPGKHLVHSKDSKAKESKKGATLGLGNMVQSEISLRKKESLGMAPVKAGSRILGRGSHAQTTEPSWACHMCTLLNKESFLACSVCSTPRLASNPAEGAD